MEVGDLGWSEAAGVGSKINFSILSFCGNSTDIGVPGSSDVCLVSISKSTSKSPFCVVMSKLN